MTKLKNIIFFAIMVFSFPSIVKAQSFHLKLYKVNDSSTFEELDKYISTNGFKKVILLKYIDNDTTTYYDGKFGSRAIIDYSPKSKIVSTFLYKWKYVSYLTDEFTKGRFNCDKEDIGCYYMNVLDIIQSENGEPTSVVLYENPFDKDIKKVIKEKNTIDTLNLSLNLPIHFIVNWENQEKIVSLDYLKQGYSSEPILEYKYTNLNNNEIRKEEIKSVTNSLFFIEFAKWVFIVFAAFLLIYIIFRAVNSNARLKAKKDLERRSEIEKQLMLQKKEAKEKKNRKIKEYEVSYGLCTKVIPNPTNSNIDFIRVYERPSVIIINDEKYSFDEIIGYNLTDNSRVIKGELSSQTTTSNASTIGRAVVGAALAGVAGAVIGGATAKQKTEYKQGEDKTIHDYSVNINVNRLSEPLVKLHIGKNEDLANEIAALINAIVVRNKI